MLSKPAPHSGQIKTLWGKQQLTTQCRTLYEHSVLGLPSDELGDVTKEAAYSSVQSPLGALCIQSTLTLWWTQMWGNGSLQLSAKPSMSTLYSVYTYSLMNMEMCSVFMNRLYSVYTYPLMSSEMWGKRQLTAQCSILYEQTAFSLHLPPDELGEESAEESQDEVHDDQPIQLLTQESFPALKSWSTMIISTNSTMVFSNTHLSDYFIKLQCVQLCTQANKIPQIKVKTILPSHDNVNSHKCNPVCSVLGLSPERCRGRIFLQRLLLWYPFHYCVTTVACNRSQSFRRRCWWQITAKHPQYLVSNKVTL